MNRRDFIKTIAAGLVSGAAAIALSRGIKEEPIKIGLFSTPKGKTRTIMILDEFADGSDWEMTSGRFDQYISSDVFKEYYRKRIKWPLIRKH